MRSNDNVLYKDIWFEDIPLNNQTDDLICIVTSVDGWWGPPESDIPEDERTYIENGNYTVPGRYGARVVEIEGAVLAQRPGTPEGLAAVVAWRDTLVNRLNRIRQIGQLYFYEDSGTKFLNVQVNDKPILEFKSLTNTLTYNIQFYAADPNKYNSKLSKKIVKITQKPPNFVKPVKDEDEEITKEIKLTSSGRTYSDEIVDGKTYGVFPRTYNKTSLFWDKEDNRYSAQITVLNEGNSNTYGTVVMNGPVTNPAVKHVEKGYFLLFNLELADGEQITIDLKDKTAKLNNKDSTSVLAKLDFSSRWFNFDPGINTLTFYGDDIQKEQIGWADATNYVTNPSVEYLGDIETFVAATSKINQTINVPIVKASIKNYALAPNSTLADGNTYTGTKSVNAATATISSWFGSTYNELDKSIKITPTSYTDSNSYITIKSTLQEGPILFSANLADVTADTTITQYIEIRYTDDESNTVIRSKGIPDTSGYAVAFLDVPEDASNVEFAIYNGRALEIGIDEETDVYGELNNSVFVKNIFIGDQIIPDFIDSVTGDIFYDTSDMYTAIKPATTTYIDRDTVNFYTIGETAIKLDDKYYSEIDKTVDEITIQYNIKTDISCSTAISLRDKAGKQLNFDYPTRNISANTPTDIDIRISKPDFDFDVYFVITPRSSSKIYSGVLNNILLVDGRYYGKYFDNTIAGLSDSTVSTGEYTQLIRQKPFGYTPVLAAVDDLEEFLDPSGKTYTRDSAGATTEYVGGVEGRTNLATNSDFSKTAGVVEVRRNYNPRPMPTAEGVNGIENPIWGVDPADGTSTFVSYSNPEMPSSFPEGIARITGIPSGLRGINVGIPYGNEVGVAAKAGEVWTNSFYVYTTNGGCSITPRIFGNAPVSTVAGTPVAIPDGKVTRVSVTGTIDSDGYISGRSLIAADSPNTIIHVWGSLLEKSSVLGDYFDGSYSPDPDLQPVWVGTENASQSYLRGFVSTNAGAYLNYSIASSYGARLIPFHETSNDSSTTVGGLGFSLSGYGVTFTPGKWYGIQAVCTLLAPQTGTHHSLARRIHLVYNNVAGWTGSRSNMSNQPPNEAGSYQAELVTQLPVDSVWANLRLYNGASLNGGDVYWDKLLIVEGDSEEEVQEKLAAGYFGNDSVTDNIITRSNPVRRSIVYAYEGGTSLALTPPKVLQDGFVEAARVDCIDWTKVPNGPVTIYGTVKPSGNYYTTYTNQRCIGVKNGNSVYYSEVAPLDDDQHTLVLKFNKTSNDVKLYLLGGALGASETFWDGIMVVSGDYNDRYFQGGMELAVWSGTEHNSTSIQTSRPYIKGSVSEILYRDAWLT